MWGNLGLHRIVCPRCLNIQWLEKNHPNGAPCAKCRYPIPYDYICDFDKAQPVYIQLFGWSKVGKTTYLDMLRLQLFYISHVWSQSSAKPITKRDHDYMSRLIDARNKGQKPPPTVPRTRDQSNVFIMKLNNLERWGSRFLVMMDHAGEMFEDFNMATMDAMPYMKKAPTVIMLISLTELAARGHRFDDPIRIYINALHRHGIDFAKKKRRLIIVLAKADLIADLPANLTEYLQSDELGSALPPDSARISLNGLLLDEYLERMQRASDTAQQWIDAEVDGGRNGLLLLRDQGVESCFALVSSTGQELSEATGIVRLAPRRVLDPFFWTLEFQSKGRS